MRTAIALLVLAAAPVVAQTKGKILRGVVVDSIGQRISYVDVSAPGGRRLVTDDSGRFRLDLERGGDFLFRRIGYKPVTMKIAAVTDSDLVVTMAPTPQMLAAMVAETQRTARVLEHRGFYRRMERASFGASGGRFVTPEDIANRRPSRTSYLLDGMPGVRMITNETGYGAMRIPATLSGCPMSLYIDGIRVWPRLASRDVRDGKLVAPMPTMIDDTMDGYVPSSSVAGIEVYPRYAPIEFPNAPETCGSAVVWTRAGSA